MSMESTPAEQLNRIDRPTTQVTAAWPEAIWPTLHLIETLRIEPGRHAPLLDLHLARLTRSAQALGFAAPPHSLTRALEARIQSVAPDTTWRLRLLLDRTGHFTLETAALPPTTEPVLLALSPWRLPSDAAWLQHKSTYRPLYDPAAHWLAAHPHIFDLIFLNERNEVCEGSRSTLYIATDQGEWLTPPLNAGALPGVQRQALLNAGHVREAVLTLNDLNQAPALRVSNALRGWLTAQKAETLKP